MNWFSVNCTTRDDFPEVVTYDEHGINVASVQESPTEREPRTAIFLFLRMSPGMSRKVDGGGEKRKERPDVESSGEDRQLPARNLARPFLARSTHITRDPYNPFT
jgi:hypothetical protein